MSEYVHPSTTVEHEGGVISGADFNSLNYNSFDDKEYDDIPDRAALIADAYIKSEMEAAEAANAAPQEQQDLAEVPEELPTAIERIYEAAYERVAHRMDQGIDEKVSWYEEDPTGEIRRAYYREQDENQARVNHTAIEDIRLQQHVNAIASINTILDPEERERALRDLRVKERLDEEKRKRDA